MTWAKVPGLRVQPFFGGQWGGVDLNSQRHPFKPLLHTAWVPPVLMKAALNRLGFLLLHENHLPVSLALADFSAQLVFIKHSF